MKRAWPVAFAVAAIATGAGCGGGDEPPPASASDSAPGETRPVGKLVAGSVAQFADCDDWRAGTREERYATIRDIRGQLTPQLSTTAESPLSDDRAYANFEKTCALSYAGSLRLYKLYAKAQGFAPLSSDAP